MSDFSSAINPAGRWPRYRWAIAVIGFIIFIIAFGIPYSFGIFFKPIGETFGWSRATISWAMTVNLLAYAVCLVPVSWAVDRVNPRLFFSTGAVLVGSCILLTSRISQPWQLYLWYGLLGTGLSFFGPIVLAIVVRWFAVQRGLALGIVSAGAGVGTLIGGPLSYWLIAAYGWRDSFTIIGIASGVVLLFCSLYFKNPPQLTVAISGTGSETIPDAARPGSSPEMTLRQAVKTRGMLLLVVTHGFTVFTIKMVMLHIAPYATDIGITPATAALALGAIGGFSVLGRLIMGLVQDRIGAPRTMIICMTIQGFTMVALPFVRSDFLFFIFAIVYGFTYGGDIPQMPAITAQYFGVASVATIYSAIATAGNVAGASGPIIAGYIYDLTRSYTTVFLGAGAGLFIGAFCVWQLKLKR